MTEDDQVGEVGSGQKQRSRRWTAGGSRTTAASRPLPAPRRVHEYRGEQRHRGVQVQQGGDHADHHRRAGEEHHAARRDPGQPLTGAGEKAVLVSYHTDEQQARDQDERRPDLSRGGPGSTRIQRRRHDGGGRSDTGEEPARPTGRAYVGIPRRVEVVGAVLAAARQVATGRANRPTIGRTTGPTGRGGSTITPSIEEAPGTRIAPER